MAQHDYNIANQSGADFRADLNNALLAIATVNSGSTEPSTTFAHQLWVDTSSSVLKIRNAADNAWITTGVSITASNTFTGNLTGNVTGNLTGNVTGNVTGDLTGNADTATTLATARTISLSGDVAGSASFDGSGDITISTTAQIDSIALGTDTTGDYVQSISGGTGVTITGGTGEGSTPSVAIGQPVATTSDVTFNIITATNEFIGDLEGGIRFNAKADGALSKGDVVYISGVSGDVPTVAQAKADDASKMPAFGLALSDANDNAALQVITFGTIEELDTSGVSEGQILYVSTTAGAYTTTAPTGESSQIQNIGKVIRSHAAAGSIKVGGAGRSNATPNLNNGKIFIGNASNQSVTATLDTSIVVENTNLYYTTTRANTDFDTRLATKDTGDLTEGSNLYYTTARVNSDFDTRLATKSTTNLAEGTNLYYTTARFDSAFTSKDTDDLSEGLTNLYYTTARFDSAFGNKTTSDLTEGTNLYYTTTRANSAIDTRVTKAFVDALGIQASSVDANSVTLGTDTVGNYVATVTGTANKITVSGSGSESANITLSLPDDVQIADSLTVAGNLTVNGTLTSLDTTNLDIEDNLFQLNAGLTGSPVNDSGMLINRGNLDNGIFMWDESVDKFTLGLTTADGSATGNITLNSLGTLVANIEGNVTGNVTGTVSSISNHSTSDLSEGSNLYYTDARAQAVSINNVVEDTTPQLGGNLASNGNNILFADSDKAIFGVGSDLQIYHDGSNSFIQENGTGDLRLSANNLLLRGDDTFIQSEDGSVNSARFNSTTGVTLFRAGSTKLATTSTGIDVTGTATMDGLTVDGTAQFNTGAAGIAEFYHTSGYGGIKATGSATGSGATIYLSNDKTGTPFDIYTIFADGSDDSLQFWSGGNPSSGTKRFNAASNGDISFYEDTGTTAKFFWDASAERLGIGTSSPSGILHLSATNPNLYITSADTGQSDIFMGGTSDPDAGIIRYADNDDSMRIFTNNAEAMRIDSSGNVGIGGASTLAALETRGNQYSARFFGTTTASGLQIYHDEVSIIAKLKNTNSGGDIMLEAGTTSGLLFFNTAGSERMRIDSSGNVGIGTSSPSSYWANADDLVVATSGNTGISVVSGTTSLGYLIFADSTAAADNTRGGLGYDHSTNNMLFRVNNDTKMTIDSSGNVGIGTDSPSVPLHVAGGSSGTNQSLFRTSSGGGGGFQIVCSDLSVANPTWQLNTFFGEQLAFGDGTSEHMRIDSSGNLLVGKTSATATNLGCQIENDGQIKTTSNGQSSLTLNRKTSDGVIAIFQKDGTTVGSIGTQSGRLTIGDGDTGIRFADDFNNIQPFNVTTNVLRDNAIDLGSSAGRFKDLYLSGGAYIGGTGAANKLDDYEEGTWTPTITGSTTAGSYSNVATSANYTKVGNLVTASMYFYGASGTGAGNLLIGGFPFSLSSTANAVGVIQANSGLVYPASTNEAIFHMVANSTTGEVRCNKTDGSAYAKMQYPTTAGYIRINITYQTG